MSKSSAYEQGYKDCDKGGNPYGGSSDHDAWNDYEDGKEDAAEDSAWEEAND